VIILQDGRKKLKSQEQSSENCRMKVAKVAG
jgi:hypothetical protein